MNANALQELKNIISLYKIYKNDALQDTDASISLYYLRLKNNEREFDSFICLCWSELIALKATYTVELKYSTKKVYSLELRENNIKIVEEVEISIKDIFADKELKKSFFERLSEGITPYSQRDFNSIDESCELIWDMDTREAQFLVKKGESILTPHDFKDEKEQMPFHFGGGMRVMIDGDGRYGVIYSKKHHLQIEYKVEIPFSYHYIRSDGFGNVELLKERVDTQNYKELLSTMLNISDGKKVECVLLNSTTRDEYITITKENLLVQHTQNGVSKPYKTIIKSFLKIKPVECENGFWGFIDKNAQEMIACQFEDWDFFRDGYCIVLESKGAYLIDEGGRVCIKDVDKISYYENGLFFVQKDGMFAVYKGSQLYIDYIDTALQLESIKQEYGLKDEELYDFLEERYCMRTGYAYLSANTPEEILLREAIVEKKHTIQKQKYSLPLSEYAKLFDIFKSDKCLREAGLWGMKVTDKDGNVGYIGWEYPASASLYDMSVELPVDGVGKLIENLEFIIIDKV